MKAAPFDYLRPDSVAETISALAEADGEGKVLAGGQSLVPLLALRMAAPTVLVDINHIPGLADITTADGVVTVGALVRHNTLAAQSEHPLLAEAARRIGHTAIRTRGTAGGSIAHADPAAELPAVALATGARATLTGPRGTRTVAADELFLGPLSTAVGEDELITELSFPRPAQWGFAEFTRREGDFALALAVAAELDGTVRIAVGGVSGVPVRPIAGEEALAGGGSAREAADQAAAALEPTADVHGSTEFRRAIAAEMIRRALRQAGID
jgi:carbon-monoxide dehydrogenase medium subunit